MTDINPHDHPEADSPEEASDRSGSEKDDLIHELPSDTEDIDLTHCKLVDIASLNLPRFKGLQRLFLRQNLIVHIPPELKSVKDGLLELELYDNRIVHMENLDDFPLLESLDLSFNKIKEIKGLHKLPSLKKLFFVQNKIGKIENLQEVPQLEELELGANRVRVIENLDHLQQLENLWLGKNKIERLENLSNLKNLCLLSLQSNRITKLEGLDQLVNLEQIYLSHNGIEELENLDALVNLTVLDVGANRLKRIQNLQKLTQLQELWLNDNQIDQTWPELEKELTPLKQLQTIYLERNPIQVKSEPTYRLKLKLMLPWLTQIDATFIRDPRNP